MTELLANTGVVVTNFLTSVTARAAAVPMLAPADVCCSVVSLRKRFPGAVKRMLFWFSMSIVITGYIHMRIPYMGVGMSTYTCDLTRPRVVAGYIGPTFRKGGTIP